MSRDAPQKFLVVRRDNIGDLVCTTPLITGLRQRYPEAFIAVLANSYNAEVLAGNPDVDEVYAYTKTKHRAPGQSRWRVQLDTFRLLRGLRRHAFDCAILATPRYQKHDILFARLAGVRAVVGFVDRVGQGVEIGVLTGGGEALHEVEDVWRLAGPMRVEGSPPPMKVIPREDRVRSLRDRLTAFGKGPVVGLHLSARKVSQRWPVGCFAALAGRLHESHHARFVVLWSPGSATDPRHPGDDEKAVELERRLAGMPVLPHRTDNLSELVAGLAACDAVVCSDGGAMHIAAALEKRIVCLFGDSDPARWRPWKAQHVVLQPPGRNVQQIGVDEVAEAFSRLTASNAA